MPVTSEQVQELKAKIEAAQRERARREGELASLQQQLDETVRELRELGLPAEEAQLIAYEEAEEAEIQIEYDRLKLAVQFDPRADVKETF